jgi:hypothetical protein
MRKHMTATCVAAVLVGLGLCGCSGMGSTGGSLFSKLGRNNVSSMASDLVNSTMSDPRLASLTSGRNIDPATSSGQVSNQLCSLLGGGCKAPLNDTQIADAAGRMTPGQSRAISEHFDSSLSRATSNPAVRDEIREAVGNKMPGVVGGIL